ncbi:hypothetical protein JD292_11950 [Leucobacter sp. CSA2]|uniref:Uncharacterized protein n=1 Tax=Leucobacter edaphi TaxID=2796472 RepID=A0A934QEX4_9MICO|nr:hypothetical protein [Leucobacter edaphi]MBK0422785.1 hypothetical protein [Leucobacter edaphi]
MHALSGGKKGLRRLLSSETNISDLIFFLSEQDSRPWREIIGFVPTSVEREASAAFNRADLKLDNGRQTALIEVKLGHFLSSKQKAAYESLTEEVSLHLAALSPDKARLGASDVRWQFHGLTELFALWGTSESNELAQALSAAIVEVLCEWEREISGVFCDRTLEAWKPMSFVTEKFMTRVIARRMAAILQEKGLYSAATVTSGGGRAILEGWEPVRGCTIDRAFIAEMRWAEGSSTGEFRFGVDFDPAEGEVEDEEIRRSSIDLAISMDPIIRSRSLIAHLEESKPELSKLIFPNRRDRPEPKGSWEEIVRHGFEGVKLPDGKKSNRNQITPAFFGDRALRHEASVHVDFSRASAEDVTDLIESTLNFLRLNQP